MAHQQFSLFDKQGKEYATCEFVAEPAVREDGRKQFVCRRCRHPTQWLPSISRTVVRPCYRQGEGWGDRLARYFSYIGITQPRMVAVFGTCNCPERQQAMNQVGWQLSDRVTKLASFFGRLRVS